MNNQAIHIETEFHQHHKAGENAFGDNWKMVDTDNGNRVISVLSDGLGSGIKASLLSNMTTTMAINFVKNNVDIKKASEIIMDTLPVCDIRKVSYSTFTIADVFLSGHTRIVEMGNPNFIHFRKGVPLMHPGQSFFSDKYSNRSITVYEFSAVCEDRIIIFSDGVTQAGMGKPSFKFGWERMGCAAYVQKVLEKDPYISARKLSQLIVDEAKRLDPDSKPRDDISCSVIYYRKPRRTLVLSGPPFRKESDPEYARHVDLFDGRKIICGGTTANIIRRELDRKIFLALPVTRSPIPPISHMDGVDLVTEGILTLTAVARKLSGKDRTETAEAVTRLVDILVDSDIIEFLVGRKINEAHQDPSLPVDLEIRRNIIKKIRSILENQYHKKVSITYI